MPQRAVNRRAGESHRLHAPPGDDGSTSAIWTPRQRRVAWLLAAVLVVVLAIRLRHNPQELGAPQDGARSGEISGQLDPNDAPEAMLAVVPHLGDRHARAIVAYRESFVRQHPNRQPFDSLHDLLRVGGLGAQTLEQIRPFLHVSANPTTSATVTAPTTAASTGPPD
jgi:hypothetical protein